MSDYEKIIRDFSLYYGISIKELKWDETKKLPVTKTNRNKKPLKGYKGLVNEAQINNKLSPELNAVQDKWIEYSIANGLHLDYPTTNYTQILKELNDYLADRVYFVGNALCPIDILMYYFLYNLVLNLSFQDKEKYLHVCRWLNNIQQDERIRLGRQIVQISRTQLYV